MAKANVAQEVASVMQKIARVTEDKDDNRGSTIYIAEQKIALEEARSCIERLLVEFNQVQLDRDVVQQEAFASTEFYEEELCSKKEYILELEVKLEQKEEFIASLQKEWQEKCQQQAMAFTKEKAEIINQLHAVQDELASIETFRKHQLEIEGELEGVKKQLVEQQTKEQQHLVELERKYIEQNERLQEELNMHVEVTNGLQKEKYALQSETAKLARDLDLLRQAEALHLQRSSSQARCIAENNSKLQKLEKSLGQVILQYSAERRDLEEEHKKIIASLQIEKQTLKRLAQTKINELKKVRQLVQQFLKERGEVEGFLIESLHEVTDHIRSAKKVPKKPLATLHHSHPHLSNDTKSSLPLITSTLGPSSSWPGNGSPLRSRHSSSPMKCIPQVSKPMDEVTNGERHVPIFESLEEVPVKTAPKIDISKLTWEEREKVLRHLFQKIHNAHQLSDAAPIRHRGYDLLYETANEDVKTLT